MIPEKFISYLHSLTPCGARLAELILERFPELHSTVKLSKTTKDKSSERYELDFFAYSPSKKIEIIIQSFPHGVLLKCKEPNEKGSTSILCHMHPTNFHRTCEAAVDFLDRIAQDQIVVARLKSRDYLFGPKQMRFLEVGAISGIQAQNIEYILNWKKLNI